MKFAGRNSEQWRNRCAMVLCTCHSIARVLDECGDNLPELIEGLMRVAALPSETSRDILLQIDV